MKKRRKATKKELKELKEFGCSCPKCGKLVEDVIVEVTTGKSGEE